MARFGFYTNNANSPKVVAGGINQVDHVDLYGMSAAYALRGPGSSVTIGATYSMGNGQGQVIGNNTTINQVSETRMAFYLIGSYQL